MYWARVFYGKTRIEIWHYGHFSPFIEVFWHELYILHILTYKLQRTCNSMVQIKWCWFHSKVFIFDQVMAKKWCTCPYLSIPFLAISRPFLGQSGWHFNGSSGNHHLSIGDEKIRLWCLFSIFDFLGHFCRWENGHEHHASTRAPDGSGPPNPTKKLAHWVDFLS